MQVRIMVRSISRVLAVLCAAALIASCSTVRLSYDHADWLLARMAGQYVDLDKDQSRLLKAQIGASRGSLGRRAGRGCCPSLSPGGQLQKTQGGQNGPLPGKRQVISLLGDHDHVDGGEIQNAQRDR